MINITSRKIIFDYIQTMLLTMVIVVAMYMVSYKYDNMKLFNIGYIIFMVIHIILFLVQLVSYLVLYVFNERFFDETSDPTLERYAKVFAIMQGIWIVVGVLTITAIKWDILNFLIILLSMQTCFDMINIFLKVNKL